MAKIPEPLLKSQASLVERKGVKHVALQPGQQEQKILLEKFRPVAKPQTPQITKFLINSLAGHFLFNAMTPAEL